MKTNKKDSRISWKLLILGPIFLPLLLAASTSENRNSLLNELEAIEVQATSENKAEDKASLAGYYEKPAHDGAWFMILKFDGDAYSGRLQQLTGMLPSLEMLLNNEVNLDQDLVLTYFIVNAEGTGFTSNLGVGTIEGGEITFDEIKEYGRKLTLTRVLEANAVTKKEIPAKLNVAGHYEKPAHDGAWFMILKLDGDAYSGRLQQLTGMLPSLEMLLNNEVNLDKDLKLTYFIVNAKGTGFVSNLGAGTIKNGEITFNEVKDYGEKLTLTKWSSY